MDGLENTLEIPGRPPFKLMVGKRMSEPEKVMVGIEGTMEIVQNSIAL